MAKTLLVDADVLAYTAVLRHEEAVEWLPSYYTWHANLELARDSAERLLDIAMEATGATSYMMALTDVEANWRHKVLPSYKLNRKGGRKPLALLPLRDMFVAEHGALIVPSLEGDDILGVWATGSYKTDSVVWSIDKDLRTIPCAYMREIPKPGEAAEIVEINEAQANWFHLMQTLMGDTTDGYTGCPGIGPKRAEKLLPENREIPQEEVLEVWESAIVPAYKKAHLSEAEALTQARVARILRKGEYSKQRKEVNLWTPDGSHT